jgi:hypothetical protein
MDRCALVKLVGFPATLVHGDPPRVENLRRAGYDAGFAPLEVNRYVTLFLNQPDRYR